MHTIHVGKFSHILKADHPVAEMPKFGLYSLVIEATSLGSELSQYNMKKNIERRRAAEREKMYSDHTQCILTEEILQLQQMIHEFVPLSQHAKISVCSYDGKSIRLAAPLAENLNPVGNVFAGSLHLTLTLAGWGLIWFLLQELGLQATVVLYDSACQYKRPVKQDFSAVCYRPGERQVEHFMKVIQRRRKGRLQAIGEVQEDGNVAVAFTGLYAVHLLA